MKYRDETNNEYKALKISITSLMDRRKSDLKLTSGCIKILAKNIAFS